jgi:hypothetical protein
MKTTRVIAAALSLLAVPLVASAQNTTIGNSASLAINGKSKYQFMDGAANLNTFYSWIVIPGKSYCVETEGGEFERTIVDTVLTVFAQDTTTVIGSNDDAPELQNWRGSRVCYTATGSGQQVNFGRVAPFGGTSPGQYYQIRVVENSLYSPWFFTGSGFEAFILIKNTTSATYAGVVTLFNPNGTVLATSASLAIPANGSLNLQLSAAAPVGFGLTAGNGGVRLTSNAALGALVANVTSLSFGQGVSFDTPMTPKTDWATH